MESLINTRVEKSISIVSKVGHFVTSRLLGGAWADLADLVVARPTLSMADETLQDTVEVEPLRFPPQLRLCDPPELGWDYTPPGAA